MADDPEIKPEEPKPGLSEEKLAELIKTQVSSSMQGVVENLRQAQTQAVTQPVKKNETDEVWDEIINPRVDGKINKASLQAEMAQDKADFYTSETWLEEVDEWLTEEDPAKRKAEKSELRSEIEKAFEQLVKSGRGMPRADVFKTVLGEKITKDRIKYVESIGKKSEKKKAQELADARKGVDIAAGVLSNFVPADVHKMSYDDVVKVYGSLTF